MTMTLYKHVANYQYNEDLDVQADYGCSEECEVEYSDVLDELGKIIVKERFGKLGLSAEQEELVAKELTSLLYEIAPSDDTIRDLWGDELIDRLC